MVNPQALQKSMESVTFTKIKNWKNNYYCYKNSLLAKKLNCDLRKSLSNFY